MKNKLKYELNLENINKVENKPGVYIIRTNLLFPRLKSKTDIIYIGKAMHLRMRLLTFPKQKGRKAIQRFLRLQQHGFKLSFSFQVSDRPKELERELILKYELKHLELPPLNHSN